MADINTVDCAGLTVALPRKPSASLQGRFEGLGDAKPMKSSLPQSTTRESSNEQKVGEEG